MSKSLKILLHFVQTKNFVLYIFQVFLVIIIWFCSKKLKKRMFEIKTHQKTLCSLKHYLKISRKNRKIFSVVRLSKVFFCCATSIFLVTYGTTDEFNHSKLQIFYLGTSLWLFLRADFFQFSKTEKQNIRTRLSRFSMSFEIIFLSNNLMSICWLWHCMQKK